MCLGDVREFVLADVVSSKRGGQIIEITDRRSREVEVQLPTIHVADSETVAHALRDEYERSGGADHLAIFEAHDVLAVEHVERFAQSWCTWIGGPNPGGSSFSITDTTPPVSISLAFTVTPMSPKSMTLPSPGPSAYGTTITTTSLTRPAAVVNRHSAGTIATWWKREKPPRTSRCRPTRAKR